MTVNDSRQIEKRVEANNLARHVEVGKIPFLYQRGTCFICIADILRIFSYIAKSIKIHPDLSFPFRGHSKVTARYANSKS
jgi:hypothetical protein